MLLKESDDLILAVYDYWVDKRLRLKRPLAPKESITYDVCIIRIYFSYLTKYAFGRPPIITNCGRHM